MPNKPRKVKIHTSDDEKSDDDVTDDSFRNPNVSLMPEDVDAKLAASLPNMNIKGAMKPNSMKVVNKPFPMNKIQANLKDGDLHKLANAITMEVNQMAAQLFEMISMLNEVIAQKPKKIFKKLANDYQKRIESSFGEHILRQVVLT